VTAEDAVDGAVVVACMPKSGSQFKIGRTTVKCAASDTSGNTETTTFRAQSEHIVELDSAMR